MSERPVALDLCVGLGGWAAGLVATGWHVIGVDIEDMFASLNEPKPDHFELVLANICDVRGADYAHVSLIVGSSPCQDFSYRAMPWRRAKALHAPFLGMFLFWQQFRIQREACEAAGRHIPLVVENVRGAIPWVGRSRWNFGSYHLWGDVPALMPSAKAVKVGGFSWSDYGKPDYKAQAFNGTAERRLADAGRKVPGFRFGGSADAPGGSFQTASVEGTNGNIPHIRDGAPHTKHLTNPANHLPEGIKCGGDWFNAEQPSISRLTSSKSPARKAASAKIAKIPFTLSQWIGWCYHPEPFSVTQ